jgi:hypothetical protein
MENEQTYKIFFSKLIRHGFSSLEIEYFKHMQSVCGFVRGEEIEENMIEISPGRQICWIEDKTMTTKIPTWCLIPFKTDQN